MSKDYLYDPQLGPCPVQWRRGRVSDLIGSIESGVSVNGEDSPARDGEIGVLKVSSVSYGRFDPSENKSVIQTDLGRVKTSPLKGHILMSRSNTPALVGASVFLDNHCPGLFLSDKLWQLIPKTEAHLSVRWLAYYLAFKPTRLRLSACATGSSLSMKNIVQADLLALPVLIPPVREQEGIASILQAWDSVIAHVDDLVGTKARYKQGLLQRLLTGNRRFRESPGRERIESLLGNLFEERQETNREDLPLLSITASRGLIPQEELDKKDTSNLDKSKYKRIAPGDIGYNTMRMWQGVSVLSSIEGIVSPAYTICIPGPKIDGRFAKHLFKYPPMVRTFWRYSQGMVDDTLSLKFHNFALIKVKLPPIDEQRRIADALDALDREIDILSRQADALTHQKKALMQKLLTGQIRVKA